MLNSLRRLLPLWAMLLLTLTGGAALAAPVAPASAITLVARPGYEGAFRPGSWMPIIVELENSGADKLVEVRVGSREGAQYATRVDLPNGGRKLVTLYVYLTSGSRRLTARLFSDGSELASQPITLQPVNANARIVAIVTPEGSAIRPPARLNNTTPLVAVRIAPADLPEHALGLSGFGSLLLEDVATADLSARQRDALRQWVMRGGQLIIGGGDGMERTLAGLPAELIPASVSAQLPVAAETLFGPTAAGIAPVPYAQLAPRQPDGNRAPYPVSLAALAGQELPALELSLGRGVVTALAFPLGHPALVGWETAPQLWAELLRVSAELPAGFAPENMTMDSFTEGNLAASLTSLPALDFPPLELLVGLVLIYIILVGPVTYLVLRRLDRQTLGWVVVPLITLLFAGLTYGFGFAQRGGDVVLNQVTLIEPVDGAVNQARVRAFVGVFSPERRSYSFAATGSGDAIPLLRPISVQGPWDVGGGGVGGVFLQDVAPGAGVDSFEIAQWSMRALSSDSVVPFGSVESRVMLDGATLSAEVRNASPYALEDVAVVQGERVARLGSIAPGETKRGELKRRQSGQPGAFGPAAPVSYLVYGEEMDAQSKQGGQPLPLLIQQRIRLLDALYNYGPSLRGGQPLLLAWADTTALQLVPADVLADEQHSAMLRSAPRVELAPGEATLGAGWLAPRFEGGQASACFGGQGTGITLGPQPALLQLTLPRDLYGFRPSELALLTSSDGPWLDDTTVELYDWAAGSWESVPITARQVAVAAPERFLSSGGALRLRLTSPQPQANFGCLYIDAKLKGAMP